METRNIIAAISLSAAVIIFYSLFFTPPPVTKENLTEKNVKSSVLLENYEFNPSSGEINYMVEDVETSLKKIENSFEGEFDKLDGISYFSDDFWFNVRGSNTEPLLRLNAEAVDQKTLDNIIDEISNIIS